MNPELFTELDKLKKTSRNAKDITPETLDLYAEELADLPTAQVVQAIRELRKSSTFFPALAEIRNRVVAIVGEAILVDPDACWGEVQRNMKEFGAAGVRRVWNGEEMVEYRMTWGSPMIAKAIAQFDWAELCTTNLEKNPTYMTTMRAQFRDALKAIQRREVDRIVSGRATETLTALDGGKAGTVRALPGKGQVA